MRSGSAAGGSLRHPGGESLLQRRVGEWSFWLVQAGVVGVTLVHGLLELWHAGSDGSVFYEGVRHLPVVAYAIPVTFASLRYGLEGGLLTGTLVTLLSLPNVIIAHRDGFGWVGEMATVVFVVVIGVVLSRVVDREQQSRARAVAVSRRLALLDGIAASISRLPDPRRFLEAILDELVDAMTLDAAGFIAPGGPTPTVYRGPFPERLMSPAGPAQAEGEAHRPLVDSDVVAIPVPGGASTGVLAVAPGAGSLLADRDLKLLVAVAGEIGLALENVRLHEVERHTRQLHLQAVTEAQEEERKRVARELHDEAQTLVSLSRGLDRLAAGPAGGGNGVEEAISELRDLAVSGIEAMRRVSRDLRPPMLDALGLVPALEWLVDSVARHGDLEVSFSFEGNPRRLRQNAEVAVFRIAQEALNNIQKHADASLAAVVTRFGEGVFELLVTDDGRGFDSAPPQGAVTLGFLGMRERAQSIGGTVTVQSRPGAGTVVTLSLAE